MHWNLAWNCLCPNSATTAKIALNTWGPRLFETIIILLFFDQNAIFYLTRSWKSSANNQICCIIKLLTHSGTLTHFCWKFVHLKKKVWWFLKNQFCEKMRPLFIFQTIDYAYTSIMLFDLCWKWQIKFCWCQMFHLHICFR